MSHFPIRIMRYPPEKSKKTCTKHMIKKKLVCGLQKLLTLLQRFFLKSSQFFAHLFSRTLFMHHPRISICLSCFICWKVRHFSKVSKNLISLPIPIFDLRLVDSKSSTVVYQVRIKYGLMVWWFLDFSIFYFILSLLYGLIMLFLWLWSV